MINLLPQKEKQDIQKEEQLKQVIIFGFLALFCFIFFYLILLFVKFDINKRLHQQEEALKQEEEKFEMSKTKNLEEEIALLNKDIAVVDSYYKNKFYLSDIIEELSEIKPSQIYLTNISYNVESREVGVLGFSPKRENLSALKQNLEQSEKIKDIYFPASNWIKAENIDFFIRFKI